MAAIVGKRTPRGHNPEVEARRLMEENEDLKVAANDQEERLKRLSTKLAKMESEISLQQRKSGATAQIAKNRGQHDEEMQKLQAMVHAKERANEAVRKQLQIIKFTPASVYGTASHRRPLSATTADAGQKRPKTPVGGAVSKQAMRSAEGMLSDATEAEQYQIVSALQLELDRCKTRLRKVQEEEKERLAEKAAAAQGKSNRWDGETVEALKLALKEIVAKTTIMLATEEHTVRTLKDQEVQLETMAKQNDALRSEETTHRSRTADLTHQKQLLELRKDKEKLESKEMDELQKELIAMNEENEVLRKAAFLAGHKKVHLKKLSEEQKVLEEETAALRAEVDDLASINNAMEADLNKIEVQGPESIASLEKLIETASSQCKYLERHTTTLKEKLETFVGSGSLDFMDPESVKQAKLLAKRTGLPIFMRGGGGGPEDQLNGLRKEIRRLRVSNANELREIGKLKEMIHLQEHIAKQREIYGNESSREATKARRDWDKKLAAAKYRLSVVEAKNARLRLQMSQQQISASQDVQPSAAAQQMQIQQLPGRAKSSGPAMASERSKAPPSLRPEDLAAGRCVVVITAKNLVLERGFSDFATEEPCTMLLADFFLHESQYSRPMLGVAPSSELRREMEVLADSTFLTYLRDEALTIQLLRVRGADFEPLATLRLPLSAMLTSGQTSVKVTSAELKSPSGSLVGRIDVSADIEGGSIAAQAKAFVEAAAGGGGAVGRVTDATVQAPFKAAGGVEVLEAMQRSIGCSYTLNISVVSLSDVRAGALMAFTRAGGPRAKLYTMHQFLEFDVAETDGIRVLDGSSASFFQKGTATYAVPCDAAWDRQLLGHRLEFCVLDESDLAGDAYVGMASMLLSPLLSRRGMRANLSLYDPDGQVSGQLKVEVAWDPEPIPPKVSRNDANRHVLEGIVRSVRALGPVSSGASALFRSWLTGGKGGSSLDEVDWLDVVQREPQRFGKPTDAEALQVFHAITDASKTPRILTESRFVDACTSWASDFGVQLAADDAAAALRSDEEVVKGASGGGDGAGGAGVKVKLQGVVLREAMRAESGDMAELKLKAVCTHCGDALQVLESGEFDNSEIAGGFASVDVEWGRGAGELEALRKGLGRGGEEEESCIEIQLWWKGMMVGRWRMMLRDISVRGDIAERVEVVAVVESPTDAKGFKVGDRLAGVDVRIEGKAVVEALTAK